MRMPVCNFHLPTPIRAYITAGLAGCSLLLWGVSAVLFFYVAAGDDLRHIMYPAMILAVVVTLAAASVATGYAVQQAAARDHLTADAANVTAHAEVLAAVAALSTQVQGLQARVERIDPWTIYTAVAADLLSQDNRR